MPGSPLADCCVEGLCHTPCRGTGGCVHSVPRDHPVSFLFVLFGEVFCVFSQWFLFFFFFWHVFTRLIIKREKGKIK